MLKYTISFSNVGSPPALDLFERHIVTVLSDVKKNQKLRKDKEEQFQHDLSDCRSELAMILYFLEQQRQILSNLRSDLERELKDMEKSLVTLRRPDCSGGAMRKLLAGFPSQFVEEVVDIGNKDPESTIEQAQEANYGDLSLIDEALMTLTGLEDMAKKIDGDAERVEESVQDILNIRRTYASIQDSHTSVLLGVAAGTFAIITIIFLPRAFVMALFALDVRGFDKFKHLSTLESTRTGSDNGTIILIAPKAGSQRDAGTLVKILGKWTSTLSTKV